MKDKKYLDRNDIRKLFESLSMSQGSYGRLLRAIDVADDESKEQFWTTLESKKFTDSVDVVMYLES